MKYLSFITTILFAICILGCQEDSSITEKDTYPYLSLPDDISMGNLSDMDFQILAQALQRISFIKTDEGFYELKTKSGSEINVSENIYQLFYEMTCQTNLTLKSNISYSRTMLLSSGENNSTTGTDCFARSVAYATGKSYSYVSTVFAMYGSDGIPLHSLSAAAAMFGGEPVGVQTMLDNPSLGNYVVIVDNCHAVNFKRGNKENILIWDPQIGASNPNHGIGLIATERITAVYRFR